tara:strand:- start:2757 stop:3521 length:765 start_codon:yes stop_codon:yes gene_type:complete
MKYLLILIIACAQNSYAAEIPFDDSSPVGTKSNRRVSEDSLSVSTNDTEPFSCDSAAAAAASSKEADHLSLEDKCQRRLFVRACERGERAIIEKLRQRKKYGRGYRRSDLFPAETIPPIARTWADVSDAEKESLGLYVRRPMPLSRTRKYRESFPVPPMPDLGRSFSTEGYGPVAECFGAYRDFYSKNPYGDTRNVYVMWPTEDGADGKDPGWYWGVTNTGRPFLYFGGDNVPKAAVHAVRSNPRASDSSWLLD